jgi:hypothetical protein
MAYGVIEGLFALIIGLAALYFTLWLFICCPPEWRKRGAGVLSSGCS